jgi:PleD family two-component response regulator
MTRLHVQIRIRLRPHGDSCLLRSFQEFLLQNARRYGIFVTMSFGVAGTDDMKTADDLLRAADDALYRVKHSGRNRVKSAEKVG